ncbi:hypothetical protein B0H19DRAFT_1084942 [Mycena capillaripes]|nr:hypothetical protein B0H19DRAFT_1084942 [Mycena capillaripes]
MSYKFDQSPYVLKGLSLECNCFQFMKIHPMEALRAILGFSLALVLALLLNFVLSAREALTGPQKSTVALIHVEVREVWEGNASRWTGAAERRVARLERELVYTVILLPQEQGAGHAKGGGRR